MQELTHAQDLLQQKKFLVASFSKSDKGNGLLSNSLMPFSPQKFNRKPVFKREYKLYNMLQLI